jgi:ubiquitin-protein ligase
MDFTIELINSFKSEFSKKNITLNSSIENEKYCLTITFNFKEFKILFFIDHKIIFESNSDYESLHLLKLLNKKTYFSLNEVVDLMNDLLEIIPKMKNYCLSCQQDIEVPSDEYSNCGKNECIFKMEEMPIGNYITETFKKNPEKVNFLLETSFITMNSPRRQDIFEPFPVHFLVQQSNNIPQRGQISTLSGNISAHQNKNWTLLDDTIRNWNSGKIVKILENSKSENDLRTNFGHNLYILIKFLLMSNKCNINQVDLIGFSKLKSYQVIHEFDKEDEFKEKSNGQTIFLYHGSRSENWYSIMRNGIKICSNTKMMTAGAVYGTGIYTSDDFNTSLTYCGYEHGNKIMGVFEVIGNKSEYKKTGTIFVVPNENKLILRYILSFDNQMSLSIAPKLNEKFNITIQQEAQVLNCRIKDKGLKRLLKDLKDVKELTEFSVMVDQSNIQKWLVTILDLDKDSDLVKDLKKYNIPSVDIEILFDDNYPYNPPFVRVVKPRFVYQTGHITSKGALCMQLLTPQKWSPAYSVESLLVQIKSTITEGGAKIDPVNHNVPYSLQEAKSSFVMVAKQHGWM